ncbi:hypothetical protein DV738_g407, partial [Chaetothyriales sp. CBS 135597]
MATQTGLRRSKRLAADGSFRKAMEEQAAILSLLNVGGALMQDDDELGLDDTVQWHDATNKGASKRKWDAGDDDDDYLDGGVVGYRHENYEARVLRRCALGDFDFSEEITAEFSETTKFYKDPTISAHGPFITLKVPSLARSDNAAVELGEPEEPVETVTSDEPDEPIEPEDVDEGKADETIEEDESDVTDPKPALRRKLAKPPAGGHLSKKYRVSFNWTPYDGHAHPTAEECQQVADILTKWTLEKNGYDINVELERVAKKPLHGARGGTVHSIINVVMSQATKNEHAIVVQNQLTKDFPYTVNGEKRVTNIPNYHIMMKLEPRELSNHIRGAGFGNQRAIHILGVLNSVYKENEKLLQVDGKLPDDIETGNPPNAPDFVPGMLSLDFLNGKTKEEIFQWLLSIDGIGVKSAVCVLEFEFGYPLCAVDTHVFNMASWLGWLPEECKDEDKAFCHLDARIPENLKHALHQLFWQHMQLCIPCKRKHDKKTPLPVGAEPCPLEALGIGRKVNRKKSLWKPKKDEQGKVIKSEVQQQSFKIGKFKTADIAARSGYVRETLHIHDDFDVNITSTNIKKEERWMYVGVDEAMRLNGQASVKKFFAPIKPEGL